VNQFSHILGARRSQRKPHESDRFTKRELWARLQVAERRNERAAMASELVARDAHNAMSAASGEVRRVFTALRDAAHNVRDIARGETL
jgi:hypothetical protein